MRKGNDTFFYHYNAHGDVIALTDQQGKVVAKYEYDAWGNPMFLASRKCMKWQLKMHTYTCQIPWLTLRD